MSSLISKLMRDLHNQEKNTRKLLDHIQDLQDLQDDLKSCAFCGQYGATLQILGGMKYVECNNCIIQTKPQTDIIKAVNAWNKRLKQT